MKVKDLLEYIYCPLTIIDGTDSCDLYDFRSNILIEQFAEREVAGVRAKYDGIEPYLEINLKCLGFEDMSKVYIRGTRMLNDKYKTFISKLDNDFYCNLYNELKKVFPGVPYDEDCIDFNSSTCGWHKVLQAVLSEDVYKEMYDNLAWYDLDFLDGEIESRLSNWYRYGVCNPTESRYELDADKNVED